MASPMQKNKERDSKALSVFSKKTNRPSPEELVEQVDQLGVRAPAIPLSFATAGRVEESPAPASTMAASAIPSAHAPAALATPIVTTEPSPASEQQPYVLLDVPLNLIVENPRNPRRNFQVGALETLGRSIAENGQDAPVQVWRRPDGRFQLSDGHRRFRSATLKGFQSLRVEVIPAPKSIADGYVKARRANTERMAQSVLDDAMSFRELLRDEELAAEAGLADKLMGNAVRMGLIPEDGPDLDDAGRTVREELKRGIIVNGRLTNRGLALLVEENESAVSRKVNLGNLPEPVLEVFAQDVEASNNLKLMTAVRKYWEADKARSTDGQHVERAVALAQKAIRQELSTKDIMRMTDKLKSPPEAEAPATKERSHLLAYRYSSGAQLTMKAFHEKERFSLDMTRVGDDAKFAQLSDGIRKLVESIYGKGELQQVTGPAKSRKD